MKRNILIVAFVQVLLLCGMVAAKQYTLNTGEPILLETQPIDPRSLFRGDYVRLNYAVSNLSLEELGGDDNFERHDDAWVVLEKDGDEAFGYHKPVSVHHEKPESGLAIKGKVQFVRSTTWDPEAGTSIPRASLAMRYGIENYFVPENTGRELEIRRQADGQENRVDIRVAVDSFGKAGIKAVLVNGEERYVERLF